MDFTYFAKIDVLVAYYTPSDFMMSLLICVLLCYDVEKFKYLQLPMVIVGQTSPLLLWQTYP